jgi:hypothetical protein
MSRNIGKANNVNKKFVVGFTMSPQKTMKPTSKFAKAISKFLIV